MQPVNQHDHRASQPTRYAFLTLVIYCSDNSANFINVYFTVNGGPVQFQAVRVSAPGLRDDTVLCTVNTLALHCRVAQPLRPSLPRTDRTLLSRQSFRTNPSMSCTGSD